MSEEMIKYYYLCNNCGSCREKCTILRTDILEAFSPRTRMTIAGNLYLNKIEFAGMEIQKEQMHLLNYPIYRVIIIIRIQSDAIGQNEPGPVIVLTEFHCYS